MSEQNINEESYEIDLNDISESNGSSTGGLVGKSSVKEVIEAASGVDPSRFWVIMMIALIIALSSVVMFGGGYLVNQISKKEVELEKKEILVESLRKEIKDCPQNTLDNLKKQQQAIEDLKANVLQDRALIKEINVIKKQDINELKKINTKLKDVVK